jgi:hypothetical protein
MKTALNAKMMSFWSWLSNMHRLSVLVDLHRTLKQWAKAHNNSPKTQKG